MLGIFARILGISHDGSINPLHYEALLLPFRSMPPPLSQAQRDRIVRCIDNGLSNPVIQNIEQIGSFVLNKIRRNLKKYGSHTAPPKPSGRRHRIAPEVAQALKVYLEGKPGAYQKELVQYLRTEWNIVCDQATVSRALKAYGLKETRKHRPKQRKASGPSAPAPSLPAPEIGPRDAPEQEIRQRLA